jgi:hypothetical protein
MGVYFSDKFSNERNQTFEILTKNENTENIEKYKTEKLKNIKPSKLDKDSDNPMFMMLCLN